jgi:hypothetical protein
MLGHGLWIQALIGKLLGSLKRLLGLDREAVWMHKGLYFGFSEWEKSKSD